MRKQDSKGFKKDYKYRTHHRNKNTDICKTKKNFKIVKNTYPVDKETC